MAVFAIVAVSVVVTAPHRVDAADVASHSCAALPGDGSTTPPAPLDGFDAERPARIVDTRDGTGGVRRPIGAGCTLRLDLDASDVPADARAVALSVTAIAPQRGFLTVFPCGAGRPPTSNLNTRGGAIPTPNLVVATPDSQRRVCIFSQLGADVVVDVTGWWLASGSNRLRTITPIRADDSRQDPGRRIVPASTERVIDLGDVVPDGATAVVGNLTATEPVDDGFMTVYPCGTSLPLASNLNFVTGESRAVAVAVGLGPGERLCVQSNVATHIVFDVTGYYEPSAQFGPVSGVQPLAGRRLADSRTGEGGWNGPFAQGTVRRLRPGAGLPNDRQATAAVLNVVATEARADGFVTVYPCDEKRPTTSVLNVTPAGEATNLVVVDLAANGEICVYTFQPTHLVVDLFGVLVADDDVFVEELSIGGHTWPAYTSDGVDYVVECGANTDVGLRLLRGTTARVNGVPVASGTVPLVTSADDRIRVELRRDGVVRQHSFRCVPADFPRLDIDLTGEPSPGWYVTSLRKAGATSGYTAVLDTRGVPVWYKRVPGDLIDVQRRDDGRLVLVQSLGPRYGVDEDRGYLEMSLSGTVTDELRAVPIPAGFTSPGGDVSELEAPHPMPTDHHEYVSLPDGGFAVIVYTPLDADLSALGPGYVVDDEISENLIQEIGPDGALRWAWQTSDHFGVDVSFPIRWGPIDGYSGNEVDVYHLNSLELVDDGSGDYVASARHMDNVFRVDHQTGAVDWVVGQVPPDSPQATKNARLTIVGDQRGGPRRPHDARLDGDVLTMFDNRTGTGQPARAVAYRIDEAAKTATLLWSIEEPGGRSSGALGSNRVLDDGNVLVSWGAGVEPGFAEYTASGDPVIEITQLGGTASYRIVKHPVGAFDAGTLRATAGGAIDP